MSEEKTGQENPPSQEDMTPQQAWDELISTMQQMSDNFPPQESKPNYSKRTKTFEDGKTMELVHIREGGKWFITTAIYQPGEMGRLISTFSIMEGYGLWAGELRNSLEMSIGDRKIRGGSLAFTHSPGFSVTGMATNQLDASRIPLENVVGWVKDNVSSPTYVPFPPITLSTYQGPA